MRTLLIYTIFCAMLMGCCNPNERTGPTKTSEDLSSVRPLKEPHLSKEQYYDKVLGLLLGSAIGDAMGAPTEMWSRRDIRLDFGFVDGLDSMIRPPSAEGTWKYNMPAGSTTDDTRWKKLAIEYLLTQDLTQPDPREFASFIVDQYVANIEELKDISSFDPEPFERNMMKISWLQEWALVAKPYAENDLKGYSDALNRFYGGEMTCAGMLYSPVIGLISPGNPSLAYEKAYRMSMFDIGYATDMTGLVSAMVAAALDPDATPHSILNVNKTVDPQGYFRSRLVGRSAYRFFQYARSIRFETDQIKLSDFDELPTVPAAMKKMEILEYVRLQRAYEMLDQVNEDVAFHPGEIYLIAITAMIFNDLEFEKSMAFIVNYGRDNDTVAAIAGAILGAYWGAQKLPQNMVDRIKDVNLKELNIDLEFLAQQLTDKYFNPGG